MPPKEVADVANIDVLDADHRKPFEQALMRILQTEIAEHTYAEILDGLPTRKSYSELNPASIKNGHPAHDHLELCPGTRERACEFRSSFDPSTLSFTSHLLLAFQGTPLGSRSFHLRLIELLVVSCHHIAVYLFQLGDAVHSHVQGGWPTAFSYSHYTAVEQNPNGIADTVGYWTEARIFGEIETECREMYIHGDFGTGTFTIFRPTAEQFDDLIHFLLVEQAPAGCPLPIVVSLKNHWRWDPWDAYAYFHIFRDRYERKVGQTKPKPQWRRPFLAPVTTLPRWARRVDEEEEQPPEQEKEAGVEVYKEARLRGPLSIYLNKRGLRCDGRCDTPADLAVTLATLPHIT
ncbi:hypothetical protein QBC46DRAFT_361876 [Diplogelasinospora grovesii]|uniref:Uncharacterized protein n=1 Tax=Diplogelasinospora grovesii TaxID=303347 RepID=A0AAN6S6V8_9PEZI|nr:hypothetical protein QBC46DRAFT_361876 [Diplogelasinospora grovesii]